MRTKFFNLCNNPEDFFRELDYNKNNGMMMIMLVVASIMFGLSAMLTSTLDPILMFIGGFLSSLIILIVSASLISLIMFVLKSKSEFHGALNVLVYSSIIFNIGLLAAALLNFIPVVGIILAAFVMVYFTFYAVAVAFKGLMVVYDADMITVLILFLLLFVSSLVLSSSLTAMNLLV